MKNLLTKLPDTALDIFSERSRFRKHENFQSSFEPCVLHRLGPLLACLTLALTAWKEIENNVLTGKKLAMTDLTCGILEKKLFFD